MWLNPQFPTDLVISTEEILTGEHHFLRSVKSDFRFPLATGTYRFKPLSCLFSFYIKVGLNLSSLNKYQRMSFGIIAVKHTFAFSGVKVKIITC